jgi:hypothetical protein
MVRKYNFGSVHTLFAAIVSSKAIVKIGAD